MTKRNFFFLVTASVAAILLLTFFASATLPFKPKGPQQIQMPYNLSLEIPTDWSVLKKPLINQIVFQNDQQQDNKCFLDVFVVQPDRDYSFSQWLSTAMSNEIFLKTGKETSFKRGSAFIGTYNFVDNFFKESVNHQRAILKSGATLVDLHMSYKNNSMCLQNFQEILDTVNF